MLGQFGLRRCNSTYPEDGETEDVGHKAENHGITPPAKICYTTGRDFHDIDHDLTKGNEHPDYKIRKPHLPERKQ